MGRLHVLRLIALAAVMLATHGAAIAEPFLSAKDQEAIRRCVGFMLTGPSYTGIEIRGDKFNCNRMGYSGQPTGSMRFLGSITYQRTMRADLNVTLSFAMKKDGTYLGGSGQIAGGDTFSLNTNGDVGSEIIDLQTYPLESTQRTGWERTAEVILKYAKSEVVRSWRNGTQTGAVTYFTNRAGGGDFRNLKIEAGKTFSGVKVDAKFPRTYIDACQAICNSERECRAWTLTADARICWLKKRTPDALPHQGDVSGLKLN